MKLEVVKTMQDVRDFIEGCEEGGCVQQVSYSTYHDALTQVCFTCKAVVTNMPVSAKPTQKPIEKLDIPSHSHDSGPMPLSVEVVDWMQQVTDAINKLQESHAKED